MFSNDLASMYARNKTFPFLYFSISRFVLFRALKMLYSCGDSKGIKFNNGDGISTLFISQSYNNFFIRKFNKNCHTYGLLKI